MLGNVYLKSNEVSFEVERRKRAGIGISLYDERNNAKRHRATTATATSSAAGGNLVPALESRDGNTFAGKKKLLQTELGGS